MSCIGLVSEAAWEGRGRDERINTVVCSYLRIVLLDLEKIEILVYRKAAATSSEGDWFTEVLHRHIFMSRSIGLMQCAEIPHKSSRFAFLVS
jgi:hypothetical protein